MKFSKKILAVIVSLCIVVSTIIFSRADTKSTPSAVLLDSLLDDRSWVLDVIVNGDYTTHPYLTVQSFDDYAEYTYTNFKNDDMLYTLMLATQFLYNGEGYLIDFLVKQPLSMLLDIAEELALSVSDDKKEDSGFIAQLIADSADSLTKTTEEKYYDYILKGIFTSEYSSDSQPGLEDEETYLTDVRMYSSLIGDLKGLVDDYKDVYSSAGDLIERHKFEYINNYIPEYIGSISDYLDNTEAIMRSGQSEEYIKNNSKSLTDSLYTLTMYQRYDGTDNQELLAWKLPLQTEYALKKTGKVLKNAGTAISAVNAAFQNLILLESLQYQKDSSLSVLDSLIETTDNSKLENSASNIRDLMSNEYDEYTILYRTGFDMVENQDFVTDLTQKGISKASTYILKDVVSTKTAKFASKAMAVKAAADLAANIGDKAVGAEETAKKFFQIDLALSLIETLKSIYTKDLMTYSSDPTEENAQKVLDDLLFLKKARLFTCKMVNDSAESQLDSWIGKLLSDGTEKDGWAAQYQGQVDILLSATLSPVSFDTFELNSGDILTVNISADTALYKKGSEYYTIGEVSRRLMGGVVLNGGSLYINGADGSGFYIPSIISKGDSTIGIQADCNVELSTYTFIQESGSVNMILNSGRFIVDDVFETKNFSATGNSTSITAEYADISGTFTLSGIDLNVNSKLNASGVTLSGFNVNILGDMNSSGTVKIENLNVVGAKEQTFTGSAATVTNLTFNNTSGKGVKLSSIVNVTGVASNAGTRVVNGKNTVLAASGNISGSYYHSDITLNGCSFSKDLTFGQGVYCQNAVTLNGVTTVKGQLSSTGSLTSNKELHVTGDIYSSGDFTCNDVLNSKGELYFTTVPSISNLVMSGATAQAISGTVTIPLTDFANNNTSSSGITINTTVNVSGNISGAENKFNSGKNLVLLETATVSGDVFNGSVSTNGWSRSEDLKIKGDLQIIGNTSFDSSIEVTGNLIQKAVTLTLDKNADLSVKGNYTAVDGITVVNSGAMKITDDVSIGTATVSGTGTFEIKGDFNAGAVSGRFGTLKIAGLLAQKFYSSGSVNTDNLEITNVSLSGVDIASKIYVANDYNSFALKIRNGSNIIVSQMNTEEDETINGDLTLNSWNGNGNLHITGNLTVGGAVTIPSGIVVTVDGNLNLNSASVLTVEEGAVLKVCKNLVASGGTHTVNGSMLVFDDSVLSSAKVGGNGTIEFKGDLYSTSCTYNKPDILFSGIVPQTISGSTYNFNNISVTNTSHSGVTVASTVNYYGTLDTGDSVINNPENLVKN